MEWSSLRTTHEDLIHDISYDFYGTRLATCSSDRSLKIYDLYDPDDPRSFSPDSVPSTSPDQQNAIRPSDTILQRREQGTSAGAVSGDGVATGGGKDRGKRWIESDSWKCADASVLKCIWAHPEYGQVVACCSIDRTVRIFEESPSEPHRSGRRWLERARLVDARAAVHDIWFAPPHLGLKLASVGADAVVRVYEALEPNNLSHWTLMDDFSVLGAGVVPARETESSFCVTWCPARFAVPSLAVGVMDQVVLYTMNSVGKWIRGASLGHGGLVRDITWGPGMGRSFQLLATACQDGHVRIYKLTELRSPADKIAPPTQGMEKGHSAKEAGGGVGWATELIGDFTDHAAQVWRVSFNVTGTILSSAGDDAKIRMWKAGYGNKFSCMSVVSMEKSGKPADGDTSMEE